MSIRLTYNQDLCDRAKREKLFLVTLAIDGRLIGDDSMTVQTAVDLKLAKRLLKIGLWLLNRRKSADVKPGIPEG